MKKWAMLLISLFAVGTAAAPLYPPTVSLVGEETITVDLTAWNQPGPWTLHTIPAGVRAELLDNLLALTAIQGEGGSFDLVHLQSDDGRNLLIPYAKAPLHRVEFAYVSPMEKTQSVSVAGSFNAWSATANPLESDTDGTFQGAIFLAPGSYQYKLVVDGQWITDPKNPKRVDNGLGGYNSILNLESGRSEACFIKRSFDHGTAVFECYSPGMPPPERIVVLLDGEIAPFSWNSPSLTVQIEGGSLLRILGRDHEGRPLPPCWTLLKDGKPRGLAGVDPGIYDSFIYSLFPDRFRNGDRGNDQSLSDPGVHHRVNYQGGDLRGVALSLEEGYFDSLGISTIWMGPLYPGPSSAAISPLDYTDEMRVMSQAKLDSLLLALADSSFAAKEPPLKPEEFPSAMAYSGYHGYWPARDRDIEPRFGTVDAMKDLVSLIHQRGLRIILDLVPHHVHEDHPWFRNHADWFQPLVLEDGTMNLRHWDEYRLSTWFDPFLPTLDLSEGSGAVDSTVASAVWWLKTFALDGFRHDATKHMPHSFWRALTTGLRAAEHEREILQLGETFGSRHLVGSYVRPAEMDGQFDFNLYYASRPLFCGTPGSSFEQVAREIRQSLHAYGPLHQMANITGSHDQTRFVTLAQRDIPPGSNERAWGWLSNAEIHDLDVYKRLQLFFLFNLSIPGIPVLYYGDEIGMPGAADPDNRRFMRFLDDLSDAEQTHLFVMRRLGQLRKHTPAFAFGDLILLHMEDQVMVYARNFFDESAVVCFNLGNEPWSGTVDFRGLPSIDQMQQRFGPGSAEMDDANATLHLPALSGLVLTAP